MRPDKLNELIEFVINEPEESEDEKSRYKWANIACELLTVDNAVINDALVCDHCYLDKLLTFLDNNHNNKRIVDRDDQTNNNENCSSSDNNAVILNPLLASFFSKVFSLLINKKCEQLFDYFEKSEKFIQFLVNHIDTSAIMDLLLKLVSSREDNFRPNIIKVCLPSLP